MSRILVTGAGGFLASPLIERLRGYGRVVATARGESRGVIACDLRDPGAARRLVDEVRPDRVYHLAGTTRARAWDEVWSAHVSGTVNLLEALSSRGAPAKVVVAGSSAEYGAAGGRRRPSETAPAEPVSIYGSCKLAQTLAAITFSRGPVSVVAARLFNVLGPGTPENLAPGAFARQLARIAAGLQAPELPVGDLAARRDYVDVRDVAAALETLMRRGRAGETYNVGSGRAVSMRSILDGLIRESGLRVKVRTDPGRLRPSEIHELAADPRKVRALGWTPRIPLKRSLADTLDSWRTK
jgi:nucleoside-diphosphate-sugar epimerase